MQKILIRITKRAIKCLNDKEELLKYYRINVDIN